ncbi:MAG TPA: hypothetical protein VFA37_05005 [Gaiellaceae bacterium]|nr:hypothetical protein [Gaiellaceae bacterium]
MQLLLRDPGYTDRLAEFLTSVGQRAVVSGPDRVDLGSGGDDARVEIEIYLRVWRVLHPEADVELAA